MGCQLILIERHINNPSSRCRVAAGSLAFELIVPAYLIANDLILTSHPIRKAQIIILEVLGLLIPESHDVRSERPDGLLGKAPWKHVVHAVLQVFCDWLHVVPGRIERFLLIPHPF